LTCRADTIPRRPTTSAPRCLFAVPPRSLITSRPHHLTATSPRYFTTSLPCHHAGSTPHHLVACALHRCRCHAASPPHRCDLLLQCRFNICLPSLLPCSAVSRPVCIRAAPLRRQSTMVLLAVCYVASPPYCLVTCQWPPPNLSTSHLAGFQLCYSKASHHACRAVFAA
jgi:hypothetical protein